jgi:ABC-2 type transport system ATP-binding protein
MAIERTRDMFPGAGSPAVLRTTDLSKSFGDVAAVDRLSLEIRRGEVFGFLGPNGAGKTTTIRMMSGLLEPDSGSVEILSGGTVFSKAVVASMIGLSPQSIVIWETLTCLEQLEFMGRVYNLDRVLARRRSEELLDAFGLREKRNKLGKTLSGGMQRRLNIALALVHQPEILFLDEPQAGLDPQSRVLVREYIRGLAGKTTVVLTTHDMEEAEKLSDRVSIIDRGRLLVLDTVENLKDRLGQGDLIEIELAAEPGPDFLAAISAAAKAPGTEGAESASPLGVRAETLSLVSARAAEILPGLLKVIEGRGMGMDHIRVRQRNLEDVFIQLTGRGLRE